ncbi:MAG: hypothetical protein ACYDHH_24135 [Solirubrobacteraceae bacterium]
MSESPWTDGDPQPGDFDAELATIDPQFLEHRDGDPNATLRIVLSIEGQDAERLQRIATARGEKPREVIAELLREADRPAA